MALQKRYSNDVESAAEEGVAVGTLEKKTGRVFVAFVQMFSSHPQEYFNAHSDMYILPLKHMKDSWRSIRPIQSASP